MSNVINLKKGEIYFHAAFLDQNLTIPIIQTWVYLGFDPEDGHVFESTIEEKEQYCFPGGISGNILNKEALSEWLLEEHNPESVAKEYEYKAI